MKTAFSLLLLLSATTVFGQADFSGKWRLNMDKSQFNETPGTPAAPRLLVEQKAGTITYQRNDRPKETLKIDGPTAIEISEPDNKTKVSMKTTVDRRGLIEIRTYSYSKREEADVATKKIRTWSLSDDKKMLTIKDHIETTRGKSFEMVLIYERQ